nr:GGDEF domain-containing protein [uncultured Acetobacterium sp.]
MDTNRINTEFIERYGNKEMLAVEKQSAAWIKIGVCLFLYGITMLIQFKFRSLFDINMSGVAAQLQVIVSTYLVISVKKQGYPIAIAMNMVVALMVAILVFGNGNMNAVPGIIVPICTIITISIISYYRKGLDAKLEEVSKQKEELTVLYEELATSEKEIIKQNIQLTEYNNEMKKKEIRQNYFAYIDILTEIPNRKMIIEKLDHLVMLARNEEMSFAVVFMDLDNFKRINTANGYHIGDLLLKAIVAKIKGIIYEEDTLGRLGSDEFALIIQHNLTEAKIYDYVERIRLALLEPFTIENIEFNIKASFGISIFPRDGTNSEEILNYADTAMCKAKENRR